MVLSISKQKYYSILDGGNRENKFHLNGKFMHCMSVKGVGFWMITDKEEWNV